MDERMVSARGVLILLRVLSEGPASTRRLEEALHEEGIHRNERTVRRWLAVLRETGFDVQRRGHRYELTGSPAKIPLSGYETLAALSVLESLAARDPLYGRHLASAAAKLREVIPTNSLRFADAGRIEFSVESASDPPEDPQVMDVLRRAVRRSQRVEIHYHSLASGTLDWRTVEPVRVYHAQRAHRLYAYAPHTSEYREFRVNRIREARVLPDKFSPQAHRQRLKPARLWLDEKTFTAYGRFVLPDPDATIEPLEDGSAIIEGSTPSTFWTVRDIAALGPGARILGGPELKQEFLNFLHETLNNYG